MPTRRKRKSEETSLSKAIQQALTAKGCRVIRLQSGILPVRRGDVTHFVHCAPAGTPDLLVILPPRSITRFAAATFTFVEVKPRRGKRSKEQLEWAAWAAANGVRCVEGRGIQQTVDSVFGEAARA